MPRSTVEVRGLTMEIYPADNYSDREIWLDGRLDEERSIDALLNKLPTENCLFVDIGGNSGTYSLLAAHKLGQSSKTVTFEPNPVQYARLKRNLGLNSLQNQVDAFPVAIGGEEKTATLMVEKGNFGEATLNPKKVRKQANTIDVEMRRLVDVLAQYQPYAFLAIKADVEGFEDEALYDFLAKATEDKLPDVILLEYTHADLWKRDLAALLSSLGYVVSFEGEGNRLYTRERH